MRCIPQPPHRPRGDVGGGGQSDPAGTIPSGLPETYAESSGTHAATSVHFALRGRSCTKPAAGGEDSVPFARPGLRAFALPAADNFSEEGRASSRATATAAPAGGRGAVAIDWLPGG